MLTSNLNKRGRASAALLALFFFGLSAAPAGAQTSSCVRNVPGSQAWFFFNTFSCPGIEVQTRTIERTIRVPPLRTVIETSYELRARRLPLTSGFISSASVRVTESPNCTFSPSLSGAYSAWKVCRIAEQPSGPPAALTLMSTRVIVTPLPR